MQETTEEEVNQEIEIWFRNDFPVNRRQISPFQKQHQQAT